MLSVFAIIVEEMNNEGECFVITLKSSREIEAMDKAGDLLAEIHESLRDFIKPGITRDGY